MKLTIKLLIAGFFLITVANAKTLVLGEAVDMSVYQPLTKVMAEPQQFIDKKITLKGKVTKVCKKRGCWADIVSGDKQLRIKVADGEIEIPIYTIGREALATGILKSQQLSKEQTIAYLEHMAKDAGETFDPATVTKGIILYQLKSDAVKIL